MVECPYLKACCSSLGLMYFLRNDSNNFSNTLDIVFRRDIGLLFVGRLWSLWGLGIMTIRAVFQELGKYECLRQAVKRLLSRIIKFVGRCLSALFGMLS